MGKSTGDIDVNSSMVSVNLSTDTDDDVSDKAGGRKEILKLFPFSETGSYLPYSPG